MTDDEVAAQRLEAVAGALGIGGLRRHILLCAQQSTPRCSGYEESSEVWRHLKARLKDLGLSSAPPPWRGGGVGVPPPDASRGAAGSVLRSKVDCLRICEQGPIAVVYPDGTWYRNVTVDVLDRIVDEHLVNGVPVTEYAFAVDDLGRD
jgi:(2Fe-2S) ferredoxin